MSNSKLVTYTNITGDRTSPRRSKIDTITIHCYVGQVTAKQGCDFFKTATRQVSSNYVVGKDGSIGLSVPESDRAWTSGGTDSKGNVIRVNGISGADNDHRAITIEVACDVDAPYAVTDKAYKALIELCADICKRNGIKKLIWKNDKTLVGKPSEQNMTVHRWFSNTACPGDYLMNHMGDIADAVNKKLGTASAASTPAPVKTETKTTTTAKKTTSFFPSKGYFAKGDEYPNVGKIASFMRRVFPSYTSEKALGNTYGPYLIAAIKEFQKRTGLEPDGMTGPLTLAKLKEFGFKEN